jgi:membrane protease YdiL (CAAX protease family)
MDKHNQKPLEFSWRHFTPGLIYILVIDFFAITGLWERVDWLRSIWFLPLIGLPWLSVLASPGRLKLMGFHRQRWLVRMGWGVVAGGIWRIISLVLNFVLASSESNLLGWGEIVAAVAIVPGIEETFFRGYIGRGLSRQIGMWPGIFIQAALFSLHPIHWSQGSIHLASIFGFGLLAGWMVERTRSIWPAWGAHAFANLLPLAF